jgi:DNA-binding HxlR family transcriptional regulator
MSTQRVSKAACHEHWCPIERTLGVIGGVWKVIIIRELLTGTKRYSYLHRTIGGVTHKMLTQQLRELERDGILHREVYKQVPPKVEYSLSQLGVRLGPTLDAMHRWGLELHEAAAADESAGEADTDAARELVTAAAT